MTPDQRYMPRAIDKSDANNDLSFSPFSTEPPFDSSMMGLIPVLMYENSPVSNLTNNFAPLMPDNLQPVQLGSKLGLTTLNPINSINNQQENYPNYLNNNTQPQPNNTPSNNIVTNNMPNNTQLNYPSDSIEDELYSYNKAPINTNTPSNTMPNTMPNSNVENNSNVIPNNNLSVVPTPSEVLRIFDLDLDEDMDLDRNHSDKKINKIYKHIKEECPGIIKVLCEYNLPEPIYKLLIKRVIKLSLNNCERE